MNNRLIAYCGLVCSDCPAYIATQADDQATLERVASEWREMYNAPEINVDSIVCDGCVTDGGRKCGHWAECEIRVCAMERGVANCAHCEEYACGKLESFFGFVPDARAILNEIRAGLTQ